MCATSKASFRRTFRHSVEKYLDALDKKLDNDADKDSVAFWKQVQARKRSNKSRTGAGIKFGDRVYRSRESICGQWGSYFHKLYSPSSSPDFDNEWEM